MSGKLRVLGIDPGLNTTGYARAGSALSGPVRVCEAGVVRSRPAARWRHASPRSTQGVSEVLAALPATGDGGGGTVQPLRTPADRDPDGTRPGRDLPGGRRGRHPRPALRGHAGQEDC